MGRSAASLTYGLDGVEETEEYLRDPVLRSRLLTIASVVAEQTRSGVTLTTLMGTPIDVMKLASSMTLFEQVAQRLHEADRLEEYASLAAVAKAILARAEAEGVPPCQFTLNVLATQ
jgi:uncharacterized protein (DUF1810 family)